MSKRKSKKNLLLNATVITSERSELGEVTITGLCLVKLTVRFYDEVNGQPENITIRNELMQSGSSAHSVHQAHLNNNNCNKQELDSCSVFLNALIDDNLLVQIVFHLY